MIGPVLPKKEIPQATENAHSQDNVLVDFHSRRNGLGGVEMSVAPFVLAAMRPNRKTTRRRTARLQGAEMAGIEYVYATLVDNNGWTIRAQPRAVRETDVDDQVY